MTKVSKEILHVGHIKATAGKNLKEETAVPNCLKTGGIFLIALKDLIYFCRKREQAALPFQEILPFL